jgi:hypothetical protein
MRGGKDSPERRQATSLVEPSREDTAGLRVDDRARLVRRSAEGEIGRVRNPLKRTISTGRFSDEEMPSRIIEAVA